MKSGRDYIPMFSSVFYNITPNDTESTGFLDPKYGMIVKLKPKFRKRIEMLIEEFEKFPEGRVYMDAWVVVGPNSREAIKNPCGTAACICGKAGLMPRFRKLGFKWEMPRSINFGACSVRNVLSKDVSNFTINPAVFFGKAVACAVFSGEWAMNNITTTQQAVCLLRAFMDNVTAANFKREYWIPPQKTVEEIRDMLPEKVEFPVNNLRLVKSCGGHGKFIDNGDALDEDRPTFSLTQRLRFDEDGFPIETA